MIHHACPYRWIFHHNKTMAFLIIPLASLEKGVSLFNYSLIFIYHRRGIFSGLLRCCLQLSLVPISFYILQQYSHDREFSCLTTAQHGHKSTFYIYVYGHSSGVNSSVNHYSMESSLAWKTSFILVGHGILLQWICRAVLYSPDPEKCLI